MGSTLGGCCPSGTEGQKFKKFCLTNASSEYKDYLSKVFQTKMLYNEDIIIGDWQKQSLRTGKGIIYSPQKFYYEGDIVDSRAQGTGRIIWPNYAIFKGSVVNNQANGQGEIYFGDEDMSLKGPWQSGNPLMNSKFQMTAKGKKSQITIMKMSFEDEKLTDTNSQALIVKINFGEGATYEGEAKCKKNGIFKIQGNGELKFDDGSYYIGQFKNGKMQGKGKYFWANNRHWYEGQYKNNFRDGQGTYYMSETNFKKGTWKGGFLPNTVQE